MDTIKFVPFAMHRTRIVVNYHIILLVIHILKHTNALKMTLQECSFASHANIKKPRGYYSYTALETVLDHFLFFVLVDDQEKRKRIEDLMRGELDTWDKSRPGTTQSIRN